MPLDSRAARQAGVLCGETDTVDVVAVGAGRRGTVEVFASDSGDLRRPSTAVDSGARIV